MLVIVPDSLREAIDKKLDSAYSDVPEAAVDREIHYATLLDYFNSNGVLPDFSFQKAKP